MADVSTPGQEYLSRAPTWRMIEALRGGTAAMRGAGETYLPKFKSEEQKNYERRLRMSKLFDAFEQTVTDLVGLPFAKPITVGEEVPPRLKDLLSDIDDKGRDVSVFAREVFEEGLAKGSDHILVDLPPLPEREAGAVVTLADENRRRPVWIHVRPEQLLDARQSTVDGIKRFTHVRILETGTEYNGYEEVQVECIREIEPGRFTVWKLDKGKWGVETTGPYDLDYVALAPFLAGKKRGVFTARPPLENLAYQNIAHWQSASDQQNILSASRFAIFVVIGADEGEDGQLALGPNTHLRLPKEGDAKFVEHSGAAIEAGAKDLETLKAEMAVAGTQLLVKRPGTRTATEREIDAVEEQSELQAITIDFNETLNLAMKYTADFMNLKSGGSLSVNNIFGVKWNARSIKEVVLKLRSLDDISLKDAYSELKKAGLLSEKFDIEAAAERAVEAGDD